MYCLPCKELCRLSFASFPKAEGVPVLSTIASSRVLSPYGPAVGKYASICQSRPHAGCCACAVFIKLGLCLFWLASFLREGGFFMQAAMGLPYYAWVGSWLSEIGRFSLSCLLPAVAILLVLFIKGTKNVPPCCRFIDPGWFALQAPGSQGAAVPAAAAIAPGFVSYLLFSMKEPAAGKCFSGYNNRW